MERSRFVLFLLFVITLSGVYSYYGLPREKIPGVKVPMIYVTSTMEGIPVERAEVVLASPIEKEMRSVSGVKRITSMITDGRVRVVLEFHHGSDIKTALEDVRSRLDSVRPRLPRSVSSLLAEELDLSSLPVLSVAVASGDLPDRTLFSMVRELKRAIESLENVFKVKAIGAREDVLTLDILPERMSYYGIQFQDLLQAFTRSHVLTDYGVLEPSVGSHKVKVKGLLESREQVLDMVLKAHGNSMVTLGNVAEVKLALQDATELVRVNGKRCVLLDISKKSGSNISEVVGQVKALLDNAREFLPDGVSLYFLSDQSREVSSILHELENTVILSVLLVMVVTVAFMGTRTAILVALSIPISFLLGIIVIYAMGYTLNIVILFTLIMVVGMLVDDAIVVSEYADRKMVYGLGRKEAYKLAASKMFWPIASATMTRLVVFIPLLFWPGITGEFMRYIPVVSISSLVGSWIMAIVFTPVLGSIFGKASATSSEDVSQINAIEDLRVHALGPAERLYVQLLNWVLDRPKKFVFTTTGVLLLSTVVYFTMGPGMEYFPNIEPDGAVIEVKSDANLSMQEKDSIVRKIEEKIAGVEGIRFFYSIVDRGLGEERIDDKAIGDIHIEFHDWYLREKSTKLLARIAALLREVPGINFDIKHQSMKPNQGKALEISLRGANIRDIEFAAGLLESAMHESQGFTGVVRDNLSSGVEWSIDVDRKKAAAFGADVVLVGQCIKMLTNGAVIGKFYHSGTSEGLDIIARFHKNYRSERGIEDLFINTAYGSVPVSYFIDKKVSRGVGMIKRVDGLRSLTVYSDLLPGYLVSERVQYLENVLKTKVGPKVTAEFLGDVEGQQESASFLLAAFCLVVLLIVTVLVGEFNNFYYVTVVMTAVFLATTCVFLGFLLTYKVFGVVMGGVGIIVLSGVVVNNNILLVDAYRENLGQLRTKREVILKSALSRLRPIFLTVITGVLGLLPMVLRVSVDFVSRRVLYDSPSSQMWFELSATTSIGLLLATVVTLLFTPAVLMLGEGRTSRKRSSQGSSDRK
ncbi:MAG: efflux RND transporter permease subunit [Anaplasma sp.]